MIIGTFLEGNRVIVRASDGANVPCDEGNGDYRDLLTAVAAGAEIAAYVPPTIDLAAYAANKRFAVETGGITVAGATIQTDRDSQAMITGAYAYAQADPSASINFKADSGWVTLTAAQMTAIGLAVGAHVQACFSAEAAIDADIAAGTVTTTAQIDTDTRWPSAS